MKKLVCIIALLCAVAVQADAQDLKGILSGVAKAVVGDKATTAASLVGTWDYVGPDCQLKGDDVLTNIGGEAAGEEVEEKVEAIYNKAGLNTIQFTFNEDNTFTTTVKGKTFNGTYTFSEEDAVINLKYGKSLKSTGVTATARLNGTTLELLFKADKLLDLIGKLTSATSNSTLKTIGTLAGQYDGMKLGLELQK